MEIYELPDEWLHSISALTKYDRFQANVGADVHTLVRPS